MPENQEKSLDDQIKEAELVKLKAETEEILRHSRQFRVFGVPAMQVIIGGIVVGFVLLNYIRPIVDLNTEVNTKEKEVNELTDRLERTKIEARSKDLEEKSKLLQIEQANLKVRSKLMAVFGPLDESEYTSALKTFRMIEANGFFDSRLNPEGQGIDNDFHPQQENTVIFDAATGLTWQQSGSKRFFEYGETRGYIEKLNSESFGGYADWRLPTLKEAMTIIEPERSDSGLNISDLFDEYQTHIWTSDTFTGAGAWAARIEVGYSSMGGGKRRLVDSFLTTNCVRAVRGRAY